MSPYRKYRLNEHCLDALETQNQAYWFGYLMADGNNHISKRDNSPIISLSSTDKDHMIKFADFVETDKPICFCSNEKIRNSGGKSKDQYRLQLISKHLSDSLSSLGCTPRKSFTLQYPLETMLPKHLERDFIRGYFDGDGCFGYVLRRNSAYPEGWVTIVGTKDFLESMATHVAETLNIRVSVIKHCKIFRLNIYGTKQTIKFMEWLYKDTDLFLQRKYDKYHYFLELRNKAIPTV